MKNREIVEAVEYCHQHGMDVSVTMNGFTYETTAVTCDPLKKWDRGVGDVK